MGSQEVEVAVTPFGNADSVATRASDGRRFFVKPLEVHRPFDEFLEDLTAQEKHEQGRGLHDDSAVAAQHEQVEYAQSQNDNLHSEYAALRGDIPGDIPWARIALEKAPDAINLWIGNSRSVTALHKDPYENIYCQVVGRKHFLLRPSLEMACVGEESLPAARYVRTKDGLEIQMGHGGWREEWGQEQGQGQGQQQRGEKEGEGLCTKGRRCK
ncbi:MAG: hypothetical protein M1815_000438 [Lichina confinis]|nr:MAG: hypothetical protein M1815_000438 [Lichina confinis]